MLKQTHYKQAINHFWQLLVLCEYLELRNVTVSSILEQRNPWAFAYRLSRGGRQLQRVFTGAVVVMCLALHILG